MPGTFSQIYVQVVFAVKGRQSLIKKDWEESLYKYITGIVQNNGDKMLAIHGVEDHIHFLIGLRPACCLSDLVREVKKSSNDYVNKNEYCHGFQWQEGFGAFSYGQSQLESVIRYIMDQKTHHDRRSFREEYIELLSKFNVKFEEQYLFDWL